MAITVLTDSTIVESTRTLTWTIPTLATGDVVVVYAITWDNGYTMNAPTGSGLTFTQRAFTASSGRQTHYIWTATAASGGSSVAVTSTVALGGASEHSGALFLLPAADGYSLAATPNTNTFVAGSGTLPQVALTGTAGSVGIFGFGDWGGSGYPGRAYLTTSTEDLYQDDDSTQVIAHTTLTGSSTTVGISTPASTGSATIMAIEVLFTTIPDWDGTGYLLQEDGTKFLLEDGSGAVVGEGFVAGGVGATADPAALVLSGVDPIASGTGSASVTTDVAALALVGQTPTLAGSGTATVTADVAILSLTGVDPAGAGSGATTVTADVATLSLAGVDPTAAGSGAASVTADPATLVLTGVDVGGSTGTGPTGATVDPAILVLSGVDLTAAGSGATSTAADPAALTIVGQTPTASGSSSASVTVDPAVITLTGITPTAAGTGVGSQTVDVAILVLSGVEVSAGGSVIQSVDTAALSLSGVDLTASGSGAASVTVDVAALTLVGVTPSLVGSGTAAIIADTATLTLGGVTPTAAGSGSVSRLADTAVLTLTGVEVIPAALVPDTNPITHTVRESGHKATIRGERTRQTVRTNTHATTKENR